MTGERSPDAADGYGLPEDSEFGEGVRKSPTAELWAELGREGGDPRFFAKVDEICGDDIKAALLGHRQMTGEERDLSAQALAMMTDHYLQIFNQRNT